MDDMVLWHNSKSRLKDCLEAITNYLEDKLLCELKPIQLNKTTQVLPFLGFRIDPYHKRLTQQSKQRFTPKILQIRS